MGFIETNLCFIFFFNLKIFEKFWRFHSKNEVEIDEIEDFTRTWAYYSQVILLAKKRHPRFALPRKSFCSLFFSRRQGRNWYYEGKKSVTHTCFKKSIITKAAFLFPKVENFQIRALLLPKVRKFETSKHTLVSKSWKLPNTADSCLQKFKKPNRALSSFQKLKFS